MSRGAKNAVLSVILAIYCVVTLLPFYFLLVRAFTPTVDSIELHLWIPKRPEINMNARIGNLASVNSIDVSDFKKQLGLKGYLDTLPAVSNAVEETALAFPFNIRRGMGLWKLLFMHPDPVIAVGGSDPQVARGRYLVEGPGHCGECHTPRNVIGGTDYSNWLAGSPAAEGEGFVPNITPGEGGIGDWAAADIAYYLESGFTPDFDSVGGAMVEVQENMAKLSKDDRDAIAAYLKTVPPRAEKR